MNSTIAATIVLAVMTSAAHAQYGTNSNRYNNGYGYGSNYGTGYGTGSNSNSHYVAPSYGINGNRQGYYATNPNNTQLDNYGTKGNYNPYTGTYGTRSPKW